MGLKLPTYEIFGWSGEKTVSLVLMTLRKAILK